MKIRFEEVKLKATRKWVDAHGHRCQRTKTFMQTINPFNKNAAGFIKSYEEIMAELLRERDQWLASPEP